MLVTAFLLFTFVSRIEATITVVSTGQAFSSEPVKGLGQHMWKDYEYVGRLQYLPLHMNLCDISEPVNIVVPQDSVPVALLASAGDCSKEDQARIASTMISPQNIVSYLIVEDSSKKTDVLEEGDTVESILESEDAIDSEDEPNVRNDDRLLFHLLSQGILRDDTITLAALKVGRKSYNRLLQIVVMESQTDRVSGGTKITLNSKLPNQTVRSILAWVTISLAFCCCSCFCVSLAYQNGVFTIETEPEAPPPRPIRRRLTVAQVREKFPSYRYYPSGDAEGQPSDEEEGLETSSQNLGECSICLDDFLSVQRVRQLPCGHVFHSTCIARWLVERNAVCPLCKLDVYEEEVEESDSSSDEGEAEADPLITNETTREQALPNQAVGSSSSSWWSFASRSSSSAAPGTRWAMRLLSRQRRRGNGDGDMLTEMTNPLLAADRSEAVEVVDFQQQSPTDAPAGAPAEAAEQPEPVATESAAATPETASNEEQEEASTPVEV